MRRNADPDHPHLEPKPWSTAAMDRGKQRLRKQDNQYAAANELGRSRKHPHQKPTKSNPKQFQSGSERAPLERTIVERPCLEKRESTRTRWRRKTRKIRRASAQGVSDNRHDFFLWVLWSLGSLGSLGPFGPWVLWSLGCSIAVL